MILWCLFPKLPTEFPFGLVRQLSAALCLVFNCLKITDRSLTNLLICSPSLAGHATCIHPEWLFEYEILNLFRVMMIHKLAQCSLIKLHQLCDSLVLLFCKAIPWDDDSSGAIFAFTSAQSAQDNLTAVYGAPHGSMLLTHNSTANFQIQSTLSLQQKRKYEFLLMPLNLLLY